MDRPPLLSIPCNNPDHDHEGMHALEVHLRETLDLPPEALAAVLAAPDEPVISVPGYGTLVRLALADPKAEPLRPIDEERDRLGEDDDFILAAPFPIPVSPALGLLTERDQPTQERLDAAYRNVLAAAAQVAAFTAIEQIEALCDAFADLLARYAPRGL